MKIAINATFLNNRPDGIGIFTREVAPRLCRLAPDTRIYAPPVDGLVALCSWHRTPPCLSGSIKTSRNLVRFLMLNTVLAARIRHDKAEVLYCPIIEYPLIPPVPTVVTVHDLHPVYFPEQFGLAGFHFKMALKRLPFAVKRIVVPSLFVKKELMRYSAIKDSRIDVVPLGYDTRLFKPQPQRMKREFLQRYDLSGPFILFVGTHFPYKNFATLFRAFQTIKNRVSHHLVVVGRKEVCHEPLPQDDRVIYLDYVPRSDLPKFYSYADLYVQPSLCEGFGLTVLEAMACETPVLAARAGSLPEVLGDAGMLCDPRNPESMGEEMVKLLTHHHLRQQLVSKSQEHCSRFSWDTTAMRIYQSLERASRSNALA